MESCAAIRNLGWFADPDRRAETLNYSALKRGRPPGAKKE